MHRPVMQAIEVLEQYRDSTLTAFPREEDVPLDGVVKEAWHDLVADEKQPGRMNRISYEVSPALGVPGEGAVQRGLGPGCPALPESGRGISLTISGHAARSIIPPCVATVRKKLETALAAFETDCTYACLLGHIAASLP